MPSDKSCPRPGAIPLIQVHAGLFLKLWRKYYELERYLARVGEPPADQFIIATFFDTIA